MWACLPKPIHAEFQVHGKDDKPTTHRIVLLLWRVNADDNRLYYMTAQGLELPAYRVFGVQW